MSPLNNRKFQSHDGDGLAVLHRPHAASPCFSTTSSTSQYKDNTQDNSPENVSNLFDDIAKKSEDG